MPLHATVLLAVLALALPAGAAASNERGRWRRPLPEGVVAGSFTFDPAAPYARGRRRGLDLRARPGAPVLAACGGVVTYAGRVPRAGLGVSVRCGAYVATELGLASVAARRGARTRAGAVLGRLGRSGVLRLGARRWRERHGYVDPQALLGGGRGSPAPPGGLPPSLRPPARRFAPAPPAAPHGARPVALPWPAWAGLGLLAAAAGGGCVARRGRRRAPRSRTRLAHRYR